MSHNIRHRPPFVCVILLAALALVATRPAAGADLSAAPPPDVRAAAESATGLSQIQIDWGDFGKEYFEVSNLRLGKVQFRDTFGHVTDLNAILFNVQSKRTFDFAFFQMKFYDEEGIECQMSSVIAFEPSYISWSPGLRARASATCLDLSKVRLIRVMDFP